MADLKLLMIDEVSKNITDTKEESKVTFKEQMSKNSLR